MLCNLKILILTFSDCDSMLTIQFGFIFFYNTHTLLQWDIPLIVYYYLTNLSIFFSFHDRFSAEPNKPLIYPFLPRTPLNGMVLKLIFQPYQLFLYQSFQLHLSLFALHSPSFISSVSARVNFDEIKTALLLLLFTSL